MMLRSRTAQTTILAAGSALAFMTAAVGNHAHAEGKLDASRAQRLLLIFFALAQVTDGQVYT